MAENRTPTGRRSSTIARHKVNYLAYGRHREAQQQKEQRGEWVGPDGKAQSHEAVLAWAREAAMAHRYTFQAVLSVPEGELTAAAFVQAMGQGQEIEQWRLIVHQDTAHCHAHVLFFGDRRMEKGRFLAWQTAVREELARQSELARQEAEQLARTPAEQMEGAEQQMAAAASAEMGPEVGAEIGAESDLTEEEGLARQRRQGLGWGW
jgi:hypothetical protein